VSVLSVRDLRVSFGGRAAVEGVSFELDAGECVALVGESGSGKSVTAMSLVGLLPRSATMRAGGIAWRDGERELDLSRADAKTLRRVRGGGIATIFQEPMTSLNPVMTIGDQIEEALRLHRGLKGRAAHDAATAALEAVGIPGARGRLRSYPHEFSGGMRQRAMIAIALACEPRVLIADEPTTALDVTVQAQILDLIDSLRVERGLAVLLITHDLGVALERAQRVCVMYGGRIVETGPMRDVLREPAHPYTRALLSAIPRVGARAGRLAAARVDEKSVELAGGERAWWLGHAAPAGSSGTVMRALGGGRSVLVWDAPVAGMSAGGSDACGS